MLRVDPGAATVCVGKVAFPPQNRHFSFEHSTGAFGSEGWDHAQGFAFGRTTNPICENCHRWMFGVLHVCENEAGAASEMLDLRSLWVYSLESIGTHEVASASH